MKTKLILLAVMLAFVFVTCKDVESATRSTLTGTVGLNENSPQVGRTITATYAPGNGSGAQTWQWFRVGTTEDSISGAASNTYTVTAADAGKKIKAQVSFADQDGSVSRTTTNAVPDAPPPAAKILTAITLNTASVKTTYNRGETLNLTGLVVTASYDNSTTAPVNNYTSVPANGATLNTLGTPTVTIIYTEGGVTATDDFIITVDDPSLPMLSGDITITPNNGVITGTPLNAHYSGDESVSYMWHRDGSNAGTGSTIKPTTAGNYTVTVSAPGYNPKTSTAVVVSLPNLSGNITITPNTGVTIGATLTANYSGSESVTFYYQWHRDGGNVGTNSTSTTYTANDPGDYTVTVSAADYAPKTSAAVTVTAAKTLSSISLTGPTKTTYNSGETLNLAGLTVTAYYSDGTTAIVNYTSTTPANGAVITANTNITVSYTEGGVTVTTSFVVTVTGGGTAVNIEMVLVHSGSFMMGQNGDGTSGNVGTPRQITLTQNFYIGRTEVTLTQWQDVMGSLPTAAWTGNNYPVGGISWFDALVFCNRLSTANGLSPAYSISGSTDPNDWGTIPINSWSDDYSKWNTVVVVGGSNGYRLPTRAQWEYAAKGGHQMSSPPKIYSGSDTVGDVAWYNGNTSYEPKAVGTKAANELVIHDMSGNVREWCWDWQGTDTNTTDPVGPSSGTSRHILGGHYNRPADDCRSATAVGTYSYERNAYNGLRVVRIAE